jgi:hypothetical protein
VSGGDVLVGVRPSVTWGTLKAVLNGADVSAAFKPDPTDSTRLIGVVSGLKNGANSLVVDNGGDSTTLALTNFPITGPMVSGPQETPFICTTDSFALPDGSKLGAPLDANCSVNRRVDYVYRTSDTKVFAPLPDPKVRPSNLATVTNNVGKTVNYIVRVETGTINRAIYQTSILHDPVSDPTPSPTTPPAGWNKKLIYPLGGGCQGGWYTQGASIVSPLNDSYLTAG